MASWRTPNLPRGFVGAAVISSKFSTLLMLFKTVKFMKFAASFLSMLLTLLVYGFSLGTGFAIGLVAMLFIHEMGHVIALRRAGLPASLPVFIPFLGALIFTPPMDQRIAEAKVAIAGPVLGSIGALGCLALWGLTGQSSDLLLLISYIGIMLNLFNLIPLSPLDGGRITQAIGHWFKWCGLIVLAGFVLYERNPNLLLICLLVLDGFTLPLWLRPALGSAIWLAMTVLFIAGYGVDRYIDGLDVAVGAVIVSMFALVDDRRKRYHDVPPSDQRPMPPRSARIGWFIAYAGLTLILFTVLGVLNTWLPVGLR